MKIHASLSILYRFRHVISGWSVGTGAAGILGSFAYLLMTSPWGLKLRPHQTLYILSFIPILIPIR